MKILKSPEHDINPPHIPWKNTQGWKCCENSNYSSNAYEKNHRVGIAIKMYSNTKVCRIPIPMKNERYLPFGVVTLAVNVLWKSDLRWADLYSQPLQVDSIPLLTKMAWKMLVWPYMQYIPMLPCMHTLAMQQLNCYLCTHVLAYITVQSPRNYEMNDAMCYDILAN